MANREEKKSDNPPCVEEKDHLEALQSLCKPLSFTSLTLLVCKAHGRDSPKMGNKISKVIDGGSSSSKLIGPRPRRSWLEFLFFALNWRIKKAGERIRRLRPKIHSRPPAKVKPVVDDPGRDSLNSLGPQEGLGGDEDSLARHDSNSSLSTSVEDERSDDRNASQPDHNVSSNGSLRRRITSWKKRKLLGSGSCGAVYEAMADDGFFFAVKEVSLLDQGSQGRQNQLQLEQEISLLSQFEHENIVRYLGTDKDGKKLYVFLEFMSKGSLATLYHKCKLRDSQVSAFTRQILNGLKYLHDQKVVHRDIKCANILVDASGTVKLADFGLAKATEMNAAKTFIGSPFWMAPEIVNPKKRSSQSNRSYGLEVDIWSLGCTVLEMLTSQRPYPKLDKAQALYKIGKGKHPPLPRSLSSDARDFILTCLQKNPKDRPSAVQLLNHPFVR
ncbi:mitogen-activated protein kinase kinase kinase 1-like isoform X2 [Eucalyptus grandis]|uniref:mitogen-activated protein kinase kinase kinase 1-like isoform X2 n=1 Tax=Eucalyptus grandis TaxID=71139 RepID=UPI00192EDB4E|nr:mitogen-activated protein kinase kinase kinase 1-like isoform X2 [Eucalyptus grandis]